MRRWILASLCLVLPALFSFVAPVAAQGDNADTRLIARARFVALAIDSVDGLVYEANASAKGVTADERSALSGVRKRLESWGRYELTDRPGYADIVIVVRLGRQGSVNVGTTTGGRGTTGRPLVQSFGGQLSTSDDILAVYSGAGGRYASVGGGTGSLLWRAMRPRAESNAWEPLFDKLRADVEAVR